jgi:hypothetical protein
MEAEIAVGGIEGSIYSFIKMSVAFHVVIRNSHRSQLK